MKNMRKLIYFMIVLCIINLFVLESGATEPLFDIVVCSNKTRIKPGEEITCNIYYVGFEDVTEDFTLCYFNGYIYVTEATAFGKNVTTGLADKGTNAQLLPRNLTKVVERPDGWTQGALNPLWGMSGEKETPVSITFNTTDETPPGEHDIKIYYFYKSSANVWYEATDVLTFYIETEAEQIEYEAIISDQGFSKLSSEFTKIAIMIGILAIVIPIVAEILRGKISRRRGKK